MTRYIDHYIRNEAERDRLDRVGVLTELFNKRAANYDREGSFPFENFEDLREIGYLKWTVPQEYGGDEISLYEMVQVQERLAYGDGSTALAAGWHLGQILHLRISRKWPEKLFADLCHDIVQHGAMMNVFASEAGTGSPSRGGRPETTAVRTEGGWLISGRKTFSTLAPILDRFVVTAHVVEEDTVSEFLIQRSEQTTIDETWNTLGMRGTGSHDVILNKAFAADHARITGKGNDDGGGWLLHIPACYMGIALAARDYALNFAKTYKPGSIQGSIATLPTVQQSIGKMEAELRTARSVLYEAAELWDQDPSSRQNMRAQLGLAKYVVTNNAISIVDQAMRIVGAASLSKERPLERYYRDIRAGLHNPPMDNNVMNQLAAEALGEE
ncbi:acyl-CoA dehydrogenase family protein [Paenibacillus dakarensis]|uniref:acyl-CoA dehydrogenase family protein n=1 Tax=Paenibacillus dakarensis TaxID=1527293 RepID=UPI0006D53864|nr:acyl-CoA dehydrogenase family protein [Paenibacillus dakarensis]